MAEKIDLNRQAHKSRQRQVQSYGTQTPLSSTAVERGSTRWLNGSRVDIDGILDVTGTATVSGTLGVSGTTTLSGSTTIAGPTGITGALTIAGSMSVTGPSTFSGTLGVTGPLTVTGETKLNGKTDIGGDTTVTGKLDVSGPMATKGTLSVEGVTTLKNDLNVDQGRKITLGGLVLENQGAGSAQVIMPGGGISASTALGMSLNHDRVSVIGQIAVGILAPRTNVSGQLWVEGATRFSHATLVFAGIPSTPNPPNLHVTSAGNVYRSTWTP